jgi:hypothetical protein
MNPAKFRFQIVRRPNDRFGWIFVKVRRSGRVRVLARSVRDYRSPEKVEDAIDRLQGAPVDDTTFVRAPFPIPATSFDIVPGVVPLLVDDDEFPEPDESDRAFIVVPAKPKAKAKPRARARKAKPRGRRRQAA